MKNLIITIIVILLIIVGIVYFTSSDEVEVSEDDVIEETTQVEGDGSFTTGDEAMSADEGDTMVDDTEVVPAE